MNCDICGKPVVGEAVNYYNHDGHYWEFFEDDGYVEYHDEEYLLVLLCKSCDTFPTQNECEDITMPIEIPTEEGKKWLLEYLNKGK